jgi:hypothetical protein
MIPLAAMLLAVTSAQGPTGTGAFELVLPDQPAFVEGSYVPGGVDVHQDGYLMVLRALGGEMTVLYPKRPTDAQAVHAGTYYPFGARAGFPGLVASREERIVIAWSPQPFSTDDMAAHTFWSADSLRHWKDRPEAAVRHASGNAPVQLISAMLVTVPPALGSADYRLARRGRYGTLTERYPVYLPNSIRDAAPRSGVPPPVCGGGVCSYSVMRLIDLTPF